MIGAALDGGPLTFRAWRVQGAEGAELVDVEPDGDTSCGDVTIRVRHSGINYKDALAAAGRGRVVRRPTLTLGIDAAGEVQASTDPRFAPGDEVLVTGHGCGEHHDGGWSELLTVPGDWIDHLPAGLGTAEAMAIGTAGLTAALAIDRLERAGIFPGDGPVAVTGATGASGQHAVAMLAHRGYEVVALSGSPDAHGLLRGLGASAVETRPGLDPDRPLGTGRWAGAVDCVGGAPLAWLLSTTRPDGAVATFGNAAGNELPTTVLPFILRGVSLLGVNAADLDAGSRRRLWERLVTDLAHPHLPLMHAVHPLADALTLAGQVLAGSTRGRIVLAMG